MSLTIFRNGCATAGIATTLLTAASAHAANPPSIAGVWSTTANQILGALTIVQGASAAACKPIGGNVFGSPIQGFYCPVTGRIVFARLNAGVPFQVYQAWVGTNVGVDRMGGSFLAWNGAGGGPTTDFNFSATK
jgi:hypothetical protein